jgi:hypothetical protein
VDDLSEKCLGQEPAVLAQLPEQGVDLPHLGGRLIAGVPAPVDQPLEPPHDLFESLTHHVVLQQASAHEKANLCWPSTASGLASRLTNGLLVMPFSTIRDRVVFCVQMPP